MGIEVRVSPPTARRAAVAFVLSASSISPLICLVLAVSFTCFSIPSTLIQSMQDHTFYLPDLDINQWRQDVADRVRHRKPRDPSASNSSSSILRLSRRNTRPGLGEISGNRQKANPDTQNNNYRAAAGESKRKRKRNMSTNRLSKQNEQDVDWTPGPEARRGKSRGCPPSNRNGQSTRGATEKVALNDQGQPQGSVKSSTGSRSPSGSRHRKTIDQPASTTSIELRFLESCDPSVKQRIPEEVRAEYNSIPEEANNLLKALREVPKGVIPSTLKVIATVTLHGCSRLTCPRLYTKVKLPLLARPETHHSSMSSCRTTRCPIHRATLSI